MQSMKDGNAAANIQSEQSISAEETLESLYSERTRIKKEVTDLQSQVSQLEQLVVVEKSKLTYALNSLSQIDMKITDVKSSSTQKFLTGSVASTGQVDGSAGETFQLLSSNNNQGALSTEAFSSISNVQSNPWSGISSNSDPFAGQ